MPKVGTTGSFDELHAETTGGFPLFKSSSKTRLAGTVFAVAAIFSLAVPAANATAPATDHGTIDEAETRAFLDEFFVDAADQDEIIAKLAAGIPLGSDSDTPPVSTENYVSGMTNVTVERWADGSLSVSETSVPVENTGNVNARSVSSCQALGGGSSYQQSYVNCVAQLRQPGKDIKFAFDYTKFNGASRIDRIFNQEIRLSAGTPSRETFQITRRETSGTTIAATARYTVVYTAGNSTFTVWLQVNIRGSAAPTTTYQT